jgi:SAM-dependent methyltransferase
MMNRIINKVESLLQSTKKYECPFCNQTSKGLIQIGFEFPVLKQKKVIGGGRRFAGCKVCGSNDRDRLIFIYLREIKRLFDTDKETKILHIAPEEKLSGQLLKAGFETYICGDFFADGYTYPAHVQNINVLNIPYPDNTFDLVICNHVLEHIEDDRKAMSELRRVLKTNGQAILQVPISKNSEITIEDFSMSDPKQREIIFGQSDHLRIYGQDYTGRLQQSGFNVQRLNISKKYRKYGLNPDEDIFICEK